MPNARVPGTEQSEAVELSSRAGFHEIFRHRYANWRELESRLIGIEANHERGLAFEQFAAFYFSYHRQLYQVRDQYFPNVDGGPFPAALVERLQLGDRDLGIDGIYVRKDDATVAVQVKFRQDLRSLTYRELATFWSEAENADYRLVFTNTPDITNVSLRRWGHLQVSREQLEELGPDFFDNLYNVATARSTARPIRKTPRPYQEQALQLIVDGFQSDSRGKLIAACGIGKTLIALWTVERIQARSTLFVAPNLHLIRQTLQEWALQSSTDLDFIVVCSDETVASAVDEVSDTSYGSDIPVTTDPAVVEHFLRSDHSARAVVLSTYQSLDVVADAIGQTQGTYSFDVAIFDEAHKTAGLDNETGFGIGLHDEHVPCRRRLFMTATERLFSPRIQERAARHSRLIFSMDNRELYGPTFYRLTFSEAIGRGIIKDYRIVVAVLAGEELRAVLNHYELVIDPDDTRQIQDVLRTEQVLNYALLTKVVEELGPSKLVSYHSTVESARVFARLLSDRRGAGDSEIDGFSIDGTMRSSERHRVIQAFQEAPVAVLTNARCLIEGVDIPVIDGVFFASAKRSLVDIVQALGRALRKPYGVDAQELAYVVIPIIVDDPDEPIDVTGSQFDRLYEVVQALRDQDPGIAEAIDRMNLSLSTNGTIPPREHLEKVILMVPGVLSIEALKDSLMLRIAEVNARPTGVRFYSSDLGPGERGSGRGRSLRTMGDYTVDSYQSQLADPTVTRMRPGGHYQRTELVVNNNNVSHAARLGLIREDSDAGFVLTRIGELYRDGRVTFRNVFRNQMLLYRDRRYAHPVYPYRLVMEFLASVGRMTYWDFLYGIYAYDPDADQESGLMDALERVEVLRSLAVRPEIANEGTKRAIAEQLADATGVQFAFNDIWTDRTTTYNQFRYFRRHLELFDELFEAAPAALVVQRGADQRIRARLSNTGQLLSDASYGDVWWHE